MGQAEQVLSSLWAEVLIDCPGANDLYTYCVPKDIEIQPGSIVSVSFGAQQVGGIIIRLLAQPPDGLSTSSIKPIESVISSTFFTKEYWQVLNRVACYYQTPFIRVLRTALPPGLLSKSQRRICINQEISAQKIEELVAQAKLSKLAIQLIETLHISPQKDYSWQHLRRQIQSGRHRSSQVTQALHELLRLGLVKTYLAPPHVPRTPKRQAVFLVNETFHQRLDHLDHLDHLDGQGLSARQQEILTGLARHGGELWLSEALQLLQTSSKTLKKIQSQGYLAIEPREVLRASSHSRALPDVPKSLTVDQDQALSVLQQMQGYGEALLHGVTGSGKTEVYLQAIAPLLRAQKSALVLVPEIGLTPQLTDRFRSRFGDQVCVYHSGLSDGERYDTWRQMLTGTAQVIVGTRSAIFAPLPNLGMIILDEEHDGSFKQDQPMPCYHARQVAQWRAELEDCPLVLGSATPAVETWVRFKAADMSALPLHYLPLPQRIHARPLPPVDIIDMRQELHAGNRTIFSRPLQVALEDMLAKGHQGILFIHRRGHSSFVSCRSCGHVMDCPHCDVSLSFHQTHSAAQGHLEVPLLWLRT
ncbi:MAG: primosomal protein N', partial [Phormidesmis sp. RL_2_1]|nr:primosomal protein N' [Phormidesmis sp. RL_2_1]